MVVAAWLPQMPWEVVEASTQSKLAISPGGAWGREESPPMAAVALHHQPTTPAVVMRRSPLWAWAAGMAVRCLQGAVPMEGAGVDLERQGAAVLVATPTKGGQPVELRPSPLAAVHTALVVLKLLPLDLAA